MGRVVVLRRRRGAPGEEVEQAPCRLGGLPSLAGQPWPRGRDGKPLVFLAQLDLGEMSRAAPALKLPQEGALAFFAGAAVHVPRGPRSPTLPPSDASPLESGGGTPHAPVEPHDARAFPCWPVELLPVDVPEVEEEEHEAALHEAIRARAPTAREVGVGSLFAPEAQRWWAHAAHLLEFLVSRPEPAGGASQRGPYDAYVEEVRAFVAGRDPWTTLDDAAWARLDQLWGRLPEFPDRTGYRGRTGLYDLEMRLLKAMPADGSPAFQALPEGMKAWLADLRTPRPRWWHTAHLLLAALRGADPALLAETERWVHGHAPSERMAPADAARFEELYARARGLEAMRFRIPVRMQDLEEITAARLLPRDAVRGALPPLWRERVERRALAVNVPPHRIGGVPTSTQGYALDLHQSGHVLLLQLQADPWMLWGFGDVGEWGFLAPTGPRGPDLSKAQAVFEMG